MYILYANGTNSNWAFFTTPIPLVVQEISGDTFMHTIY